MHFRSAQVPAQCTFGRALIRGGDGGPKGLGTPRAQTRFLTQGLLLRWTIAAGAEQLLWLIGQAQVLSLGQIQFRCQDDSAALPHRFLCLSWQA